MLMRTNYMKRNLLLAGAAVAMAVSVNAGNWVDVTHKYVKETSYLPGWQGVIGAVGEGVGEVWNGAFRLYQVVPNAPAGNYTLTCNALYRCGTKEYTFEKMKGNADLHTAYIFINNEKKAVEGLADGTLVLPAATKFNEQNEPTEWEAFDVTKHAPNNLGEVKATFEAGNYKNTLTVEHKGGDLIIGIANTGCYNDEWCAFDNFKLTGPSGDVALVNGDFATGIDSKRAWDNWSTENKEKTPDMQKDGSGGGDFRKCGGSPYKYGQQIELPAGKYRFGMLTFHRYGSELDAKGNYYNHKWPCSNFLADMTPQPAYGKLNRTPKDWFDAKDYDAKSAEYDHAYIFMSQNAACPKDLNFSEDLGDLTENKDKRVRVKDCWEITNGDLDAMPHNNPVRVAGNDAPENYEDWKDILPYETRNKVFKRNDSGNEREAAAAFVNEPEKYYQYVEFELTEPTKVWVGMGKNTNTSDGYWHAWAYQTLKVWDENAQGSAVNEIEMVDENAPVEYYNLQGVRVANPSTGIFIVRQGNKVSKRVIK